MVVGVGVGMSRDCSTGKIGDGEFVCISYFEIHFFCYPVMVAQYFKRKREVVEVRNY